MSRATAHERLEYGDAVCAQLAAGASIAGIASRQAVSPQHVSKAAWLSRKYGPGLREAVGGDVLRALSPGHLEATAAAGEDDRVALLQRAEADRLSVRQLKALAGGGWSTRPSGDRRNDGAAPLPLSRAGGGEDLASVSRAFDHYEAWGDDQLRKLLAGPNGDGVLAVARKGRRLAERIERNSLA